MKILLIRTWSGELPQWYNKWCEQMEKLRKYGIDYLVIGDRDFIGKRIKEKLGLDTNFKEHYRCISDFDPTFGILFEDYIKGYDYWGHINLDCVYGRIDRFITDEFLKDVDIFGNDPDAVCGPFTLYKNTERVNNLFYSIENWKGILTNTELLAFDEHYMTELLKTRPDIKFKSGFLQKNDKLVRPEDIKILSDGTLINKESDKEIMMYHFNTTRQWIYS
jgi:hypothetical protein